MEELQIIEEKPDEIFSQIMENNIDFEYLKNLNETKQSFLSVNNFDLKEPDFSEYTEDDFIEYIENNKSIEIIKKNEEMGIEEDFRSSMSQIYFSKDGKRKMFVLFLPKSQNKGNVGIDIIKNFLKLVRILDCTDGVIISEQILTPKSIEKIDSTNIRTIHKDGIYNVISYTDSMFINVSDHCLTPEVLKVYSGDELETFLENERLDKYKLPKMVAGDPISKFYMAKVGDVIKMKRKTGTQDTVPNEQIVYRLVIYGKIKKI